MDVNAVPPIRREYTFPRKPTTNAPIADTTSERLKMKWSATLFAAYDTHEMTTMTTSSTVQNGCRFASEDRIEKMGTMMNCVHHGNGCLHHGQEGSR